MSRTQAAGKKRSRWTCNNRDCDWFQGPGEHKPQDGHCPKCGYAKLSKQMRQVAAGLIDFDAVQAELVTKGIELRGGGADEAPGAYKRLDEVLSAHAGTIRIRNRLTPIGVAMARADTFDPYKD
jgi:tRNA-splicing ligase RtcB